MRERGGGPLIWWQLREGGRLVVRRLRRAAPAAPAVVAALAPTADGDAAGLRAARAACVSAVAEFRRAHLALATSFIIRPAMRAAKPAEARLS